MVVFIGLTIYNLIKLDCSFEKKYIYDLEKDLKQIASNNNTKAFIDADVFHKEYYRIFSKNGISLECHGIFLEDNLDYKDFMNAYYYHDPIRNDIYLLLQEKKENEKKYSEYLNQQSISIKRIRKYYTNENKTNAYIIYKSKQSNIIQHEEFQTIVKDGELKAFIPEQDIFIYQTKNRIYWFVNKDVDKKAQITYRIYPKDSELLPEDLVEKGYDDRGFVIEKERTWKNGDYLVFDRAIPTEYPISMILSGICINDNFEGARYITVTTDDEQ